MKKMSEEEIIARVQNLIDYINFKPDRKYNTHFAIIAFPDEQWFQAIQGLLDLYKQEKEERQKFEKAFKQRMEYSHELEKDLFENCSNYVISKDKIRAKIKELENAIEPWGDEDLRYQLKIKDKAQIEVLKELLKEN